MIDEYRCGAGSQLFMGQVHEPSCWSGDSLKDIEWWWHLTVDEIEAFERVQRHVSQHIGGDANQLLRLAAGMFAEHEIEQLAARVRVELEHGRGFVLLRGLPVMRWSRMQTLIAYWSLGLALGTPVPNNALGDMVGHVRSHNADYNDPSNRGYDTAARLAWHCDQCDVVALLCLHPAREGGESKLASFGAIYRKLQWQHPEHLKTLCQPFYWSRMGEMAAGQRAWYQAPVFQWVDDELNGAAGANHIRKGHQLNDAPPMSHAQSAALDQFESAANSLELAMPFEPGDIQLLNNALVVHTRTAFKDWPEPQRRRHLWRLWLNVAPLHRGAAYYENWRHGIVVGHARRQLRLTT